MAREELMYDAIGDQPRAEPLKSAAPGSHLVFPDFDDLKVSTMTFTACTNLVINLDQLADILPVTPYVVIPKKRGRKKKTDASDPNENLAYGSIITVRSRNQVRGVDLSSEKPVGKLAWASKRYFRNSITVVLHLDKNINFKVCQNGTFQMTGCKSHEHAEMCVQTIWYYMKDCPEIYKFSRGSHLEALFIPCMRNVDFFLGFMVDRVKLNNYMFNQDKFNCILEASFKYAGVNIKIPLRRDICTTEIKKLAYNNDEWISSWTTYGEYINLLPEDERQSKIDTPRYTTCLIFHSGKVILSGLTKEFMRTEYHYFLDIMRECYDQIEERLERRV